MQIQKRGGRFLSYHHHCGPLLAPGNSQSNRRIPISSLQGSTTAYVSRDLLSHLPISKKDILQWTKVKVLCLKAKYNANNTELLTLLTNSLTQPLSMKITHLSLFFGEKKKNKNKKRNLFPYTNTTPCSTGNNYYCFQKVWLAHIHEIKSKCSHFISSSEIAASIQNGEGACILKD